MKQYKLYNNITGWTIFIIAAVVYIITSEPTASFWDPGEYISTSYKLQVGHPPGAPTFQLLGRFFSLFAFGNVHLVARMINSMSAIASALSILFLFWTITKLARKLLVKTENDAEYSIEKILIILGSGLVGALAYTFSDSFWFSAVEGEVYATSSFFTAFVVWAMLKWEEESEERYSYRWIILIAFMMGLSIGVHLLNLLAIPAITFIYYFKKFTLSKKGVLITLVISVILLSAVMFGIIPNIVDVFANTELLFVNYFRLPFFSGTVFFFLFLIALIITGVLYSYKTENKKIKTALIALLLIGAALVLFSSTTTLNFFMRIAVTSLCITALYLLRNNYGLIRIITLSFAFILIGYSSFMVLVIRSNANTPINENTPDDAINLLSYLNREQYGDWPIFYGQYYNSPLDKDKPYTDGRPLYAKDHKTHKYIVIDDRKNVIPNYDSRFCTFFPRMWSSSRELHALGYKSWGEVKGVPIAYEKKDGSSEIIYMPTFAENLRYFFRYQLGHMYFRYFMWNFAGKQNDIQGNGGIINGNWISGIKVLDEKIVGPQDTLTDYMKSNPGRNTFYFLPLILGFVGFFYQLNKNSQNATIVGLLFLFTGIAIEVYLNMAPYQPRERDYAFAASFYAFSIWIGIGVIALYELISKKIKPKLSAIIATLLCLICVPGIMAKEGWDDHDRSGRRTTVDIASDYLNSCAPNAILFTIGDNETFPLWYAQEVEGIRTDIRVVNLSLFNADWYINQMRRKVYESEPLPISIPKEKYIANQRDYSFIYEDTTIVPKGVYTELGPLIKFACNDAVDFKLRTSRGYANYFPTGYFKINVDSAKVLKNGTVATEYADSVLKAVEWKLNYYGVDKSSLLQLDILANFNWDRPIYFAVTSGEDAYIGLSQYFQMEGLAYRLVPLKMKSHDGKTGFVNTRIMYDNLMNKFKWGNMNDPHVYLDETNIFTINNIRGLFSRLATALLTEGKPKEAVKVCDKCIDVMPDNCLPYDDKILPIAEVYYMSGEKEKADEVISKLLENTNQEVIYYSSFTGVDAAYVQSEKKQSVELIKKIVELTANYQREELNGKVVKVFKSYK
jgi:hypothetical protein